jgi:hypothetical protein
MSFNKIMPIGAEEILEIAKQEQIEEIEEQIDLDSLKNTLPMNVFLLKDLIGDLKSLEKLDRSAEVDFNNYYYKQLSSFTAIRYSDERSVFNSDSGSMNDTLITEIAVIFDQGSSSIFNPIQFKEYYILSPLDSIDKLTSKNDLYMITSINNIVRSPTTDKILIKMSLEQLSKYDTQNTIFFTEYPETTNGDINNISISTSLPLSSFDVISETIQTIDSLYDVYANQAQELN